MKYQKLVSATQLEIAQIGASSEMEDLCNEIKQSWCEIERLEKLVDDAGTVRMEFYSQLAGEIIAGMVTDHLYVLIDPVKIGAEIAKQFKDVVTE